MARRLALASAVAVVVAVFSLALFGHWVSDRARIMLRTAQELSQQETQPTLDEIRQRYGGKLKAEGCDARGCAYSVTLSNHVLAALRLVPYTELQAYFWVQNGRVLESRLDYTTMVGDRKNVTAHAAVDFERGCVFSLDPWEASSLKDSNGSANVTSDCSGAEKVAVLALNVTCLTKLGGCGTVADLIPAMWEQNRDGTIRCRISSCEGFVHPPASWTWTKGKGECIAAVGAAHAP